MDDRIVIVTGATSGIGLETAKLFAAKGCRVYGISRGSFAPPSGTGVEYITADVTDEAGIKAAIEGVASREGRIDVLVNNAGFGISGPVELTDTGAAKRQFDVNLFGMHNCIKAALPALQEAGGVIINLSSVAAVTPIPYQAFYSASKAAINALTMALANELKGRASKSGVPVRAAALMPGDVKTGFTAARQKDTAGAKLYPKLESSLGKMEHDEQNGMPPAALAARAYAISLKKHPKPLYSCGLMYQFFCVLAKALPNRLVNWILKLMYA